MLSFAETASTQAGKRELHLVLVCHNHLKLTLACFFRLPSLLSRPTRYHHPSATKNVISFIRLSVGGSIVYYRIFVCPNGGPTTYICGSQKGILKGTETRIRHYGPD